MNILIERFRIHERPELAREALIIRTEVFVKGQQVDRALEYEFEDESNHYLLFLDEKPVATARWRETTKGIKLERFATLQNQRNKGFGSLLLKAVLNDTIPLNKPIYLHAQLTAADFYLKHGFRRSGDVFHEAGIEHYTMILPAD